MRSLLVIALTLLLFAGCEEYSIEGMNGPDPAPLDSLPVPDPGPVPGQASFLPPCADCEGMDRFVAERWSFYVGTTLVCGVVDTAIASHTRNSFTFFGPSACSIDTGLVFTVYLGNETLTKDLFNYKVPYTAFYYYQHDTLEPHILISRLGEGVPFVIDRYNYTDKTISGRFTGYVYRSDGSKVLVSSGKFQTKVQ